MTFNKITESEIESFSLDELNHLDFASIPGLVIAPLCACNALTGDVESVRQKMVKL